MSQYDFGNLSSPVTGADLIDTHLEPFRDALHTTHSGTSRPSYVESGMIWLDTTATPWLLKMYDGTADITLGAINATTDRFEPAGKYVYGGTVGGTANAITLTPAPAHPAYADGDVFTFTASSDTTSEAVTINISALGTKSLKVFQGAGKVNPAVGVVQSGMVVNAVYDGTDLVLLNPRPYNESASIATAATVNLDNASGDYVELTGTTAVTAITIEQGVQRTCRCAAAFTLTDGASLILPGGANITTAAGDVFVVRGESSSVARVVSYTKADGTAVVGGGGIQGWVNFSGTGTVTIRDHDNVTSITDNGTGDYTIVWDTDFSNDDYACIVHAGDTGQVSAVTRMHTQQVGSIRFEVSELGGALTDTAFFYAIAVGDQ